ncbi:MAG: prepilin-type N-terminal cleavage/methylation domain-containing protein [Candidatus Muiribacteriota bacterium]
MKAFTIIELIITITIISIIAIVATPWIIDSMDGAKENTLLYNLDSIRRAINQYYSDWEMYPRSLEVLEIKGYLPQIPSDPTLGEADWEIAINYWCDISDSFVERWVLVAGENKFAGKGFIVPIAENTPYFDPPIRGGEPRYGSHRGIRNVRSRNRYDLTHVNISSLEPEDPRLDPAYYNDNSKTFGKPLHQYWRVNKTRSDSTPENTYPYYLIEHISFGKAHLYNYLNDNDDDINYPSDEVLFDKYAGNYFFSSTNAQTEAKNRAQDIEITGVDSFYE